MNQIEDTLNIDTPENVTFGYEIAGIGSRFLAALIDTALITFLQVLTALLVFSIINQADGYTDNLTSTISALSSWAVAIIGIVGMCFYWGYYIFFEMVWNGRSPGKKVLKLRVLRVDGTPITITESLIRNLVRLADFLPAYYGVGAIAAFVNPQTRRLGDLAAGTVVVRETDQQAQLKDLAALEKQFATSPVPTSGQAPVEPAAGIHENLPGAEFPIEMLSYQDIQMIEMFFQRRNELSNRVDLSARLVDMLWEKMNLTIPKPTRDASEKTLASVISQIHQTRSK